MKSAKDSSRKNNNSDKVKPSGANQSSGQKSTDTSANVSGEGSGKKEGRRDFKGNRRWRRNRYRDNRNKDRNKDRPDDNRENEQNKNRVILKCDICSNDIKDITSAIGSGSLNKPVHFDCMLEKLKSENKLESTDKIVYLGAGNFGIVRQEKNKPAKEFTIIKKIEVENRDEKPDWRSEQLKVK